MSSKTETAVPIPASRSGSKENKVAVLGGGPGPEREGALASARDLSAALADMGFDHELLDLSDIEHLDLRKFERVVLTTHGQWGEDGRLQGYLETLRVPYTGSSVMPSAIAMHKPTMNSLAASLGFAIPTTVIISERASRDEIMEALRTTGDDVIMRPSTGGGSRGVIRSSHPDELMAHLEANRDEFDEYLLSAFIDGVEVSAAFRSQGGQITALPFLATYHDGDFYDYRIKHDAGARRHVCPADIDAVSWTLIEQACPTLYRKLQLVGFVRFDFIVDRGGTPWFLEINTLPGMSREGNLATMAAAANMTYEDLVLEYVSHLAAFAKRAG